MMRAHFCEVLDGRSECLYSPMERMKYSIGFLTLKDPLLHPLAVFYTGWSIKQAMRTPVIQLLLSLPGASTKRLQSTKHCQWAIEEFNLERSVSCRLQQLRSICLCSKFGLGDVFAMKIWHHFPWICTKLRRIILYQILLLSASALEFEIQIIKNKLIIFYLLLFPVMLPPYLPVHVIKLRSLICIYSISWSAQSRVKSTVLNVRNIGRRNQGPK